MSRIPAAVLVFCLAPSHQANLPMNQCLLLSFPDGPKGAPMWPQYKLRGNVEEQGSLDKGCSQPLRDSDTEMALLSLHPGVRGPFLPLYPSVIVYRLC